MAEEAGELSVEELSRLLEVETIERTEAHEKRLWFGEVFDHFRNRCCSCGSEDHLTPKLMVPVEAGGQLVMPNSMLICRTCELAIEIVNRKKVSASGENTRPINFWIARPLHQTLRNGLSHKHGFNSVASLVRFLMSRYIASPEQFEDVEKYVDKSSDVKVNVWVPRDMYESFKTVTTKNGLTVTDSLRGLLRMYGSESERIFGRVG